ncbi:MAG: hypothetical protein ACYC35_26190 [Pirellulales bacterium]
MSVIECAQVLTAVDGLPSGTSSAGRTLHRLGQVRRQQRISLRTMARQLKRDVREVRLQEEETADLPLSVLYQWQHVLEVPIAELLVDSDGSLSTPIMERAQLVKLMKTASAILERAERPSIRRMAQMLVEQLIQIMPELKGVGPWHAVGQRRSLDEYGRVVERRLTEEMLHGDL